MSKHLKNMSKKLKINRFPKDPGAKMPPVERDYFSMTHNELMYYKMAVVAGFVFALVGMVFGVVSMGKTAQTQKTNEILLKRLDADSIVISTLMKERETLKALKSTVSEIRSDIDSETDRLNLVVDRIDYIEGMTYDEHLYYIIKNKKKK